MNRIARIKNLVVMALMAFLTSACSMMEDDLKDCPTGLYVRFVYDYNTARADMFKDHVGYVVLYVYNAEGKKVAERTVSNGNGSAPLREYGHTIHFGDNELPDGQYRLQAVAMQKDWDDALATKGAKYRRNSPVSHTDLNISLDTSDAPVDAGGRFHPVSAAAPLDTLWHTLRVTADEPADGTAAAPLHQTKKPYSIYPLDGQYVTVRSGYATYATVSLIRDTKHLNITLRQLDSPQDVHADDYDVYITDNNTLLAHDNELIPDKDALYTPYSSWTTFFDGNDIIIEPKSRAAADINRTAHYNIMFNRLMLRDDSRNNARLYIVNRNTRDIIADINLPSILAEGRIAYDLYGYSAQEYLDREYDYHLDFFLKGDRWEFVDVTINVLSWSKRVQRAEL